MYKNKSLLDLYLSDYLAKPYSKRLTSSIKRFEDMYNPKSYLYGGRLMPGYVDDLKHLKAQIYLTNKKLIKSFDTRHGKQIILTSSGEKVLFKQYPLSTLREKKWDGKWTIISYDILENHRNIRDNLRKVIKDYGFGLFQKSLYLSPLNIGEGVQDFFKSKGILNSVQVFRASSVYGINNQEIVEKIYNISELNNLYTDLKANYSQVVENVKLFSKWKDYFMAVNYKDPYLPFELLPQEWEGDNCEKLFTNKTSKNIFKLLLKKYHDRSVKLA